MSAAYIEEFLYRGRCPENEAGQASTFHVVLAQFADAPGGGKQVLRSSPQTPAQALAAGYSLDKILGAIANQAALERDAAAALIVAMKAEIESANSAKAAAEADWHEIADQLSDAEEDKRAAQRAAADAIKAKQEVADDLTAAMARIDELTSEPEGPKNPALHFLTGGLLGG